MGVTFEGRGALYRESYDYIRYMSETSPAFENRHGTPGAGIDMLPKPAAGKLPLLITGSSQQDQDWIARNGDGWMLYPRKAALQSKVIAEWRERIEQAGGPDRPAMEPLYIDLIDDPDAPPQPIHLGLRLGVRHLRTYLRSRRDIGVNHVALNLRFNRADIETTLKRLANDVLSEIPTLGQEQ